MARALALHTLQQEPTQRFEQALWPDARPVDQGPGWKVDQGPGWKDAEGPVS